MRNFTIILLFTFFAFSCRQSNRSDKTYNWTEQEIKQYYIDSIAMCNGNYDNPDSLNKFRYFMKSFYDNSKAINYRDEFVYAFDEPYIDTTKNYENKKWLRLIARPSFDKPYCITIEKIRNRTKATIKITNGESGCPGYLALTNNSYYSDTFYNSIIKRLELINFWDLKTDDKSCGTILDGTGYTFEVINDDKYNIMFLYSPQYCKSNSSRVLSDIIAELSEKTNLGFYYSLKPDAQKDQKRLPTLGLAL